MILAYQVLRGLQGTEGVTDASLQTTCQKCGKELTLADATVAEEREVTVYRCPKDRQILTIITPVGIEPVEGSGYRLGDHVIRNPRDLVLSLAGTPAKLVIDASPNALKGWEPAVE